MKRFSNRIFPFLLAIVILILSLPGLARAQSELAPVFILLKANTTASERQLVEAAVITAGGHTTHVFPNRALVAQLPPAATATISALAPVSTVRTNAINLSEMDVYGADARRLAGIWNSLLVPQNDDAALVAAQLDAQHPEQLPDMFEAPNRATNNELAAAATSSRPGYYNTSDFMAGSVAVGIVLLESDGSAEPSTENWTSDEKQLVLAEIVNAFNWWAQLKPAANLTFVYDDHATNPLPTGVEPINHRATDLTYGERRWIGDAMKSLGYNHYSYFSQVDAYNNAMRTAYNTDWAFTIFVADSSTDADNKFVDGYFAYAYLGGPFMVMTSGNNGYGPTNMDAVAAHEIGHIFYALDQYYNAAQSCTKTSGYLQVDNQNSLYGTCSSNQNSIMRGQIFPYTAKAIDPYAAGQIGWRDSDADGIIDPLDVSLPVTIDSFEQDVNAIAVSGSAQILPYPAASSTSFTINQFESVQYRLDDGNWQTATIDEIGWEGVELEFSFTAANLDPGNHTVEVAAVDDAGNFSDIYATREFTVDAAVDGGVNTLLNPSTGPTVTGVARHYASGIITTVQYRVNGGEWATASPVDGAFDSAYEEFSILMDMLVGAETQSVLVEARAEDDTGYIETSVASQQVQLGSGQSYSVFIPIVIQ